MEWTSERSQKGQYTSKRGRVLENDMIAKCESVQGQRTQLSEFSPSKMTGLTETWQFSNAVYEIHLSSSTKSISG